MDSHPLDQQTQEKLWLWVSSIISLVLNECFFYIISNLRDNKQMTLNTINTSHKAWQMEEHLLTNYDHVSTLLLRSELLALIQHTLEGGSLLSDESVENFRQPSFICSK